MRMKIAVLGSGGIGGYYGVELLRGGHDVVFIARSSHLEAMRRSGLTIRTASGEAVVPVSAVADTRDAGPVDLVLFCVKAYDTGEAADALPPLLGPDTSVLTLQNGVDSAALVSAVAGAGRVLAGAVYVALQITAPGVIRHTGGDGRIVFGVPSGAATAQAERVAEAFQRAGIPHALSPDIDEVLWEKFLFITGVGAVTAMARSGIGPLMKSAEGYALVTASCGEVVAVGRREGHLRRPDAVEAVVAQAGALPAEWCSSMARDLVDGRRLEVEALSGAVVRRGRAHGIPTPVHQAIAACLSLNQPPLSVPVAAAVA
jgi:2-dehydropantoate 2-reductase